MTRNTLRNVSATCATVACLLASSVTGKSTVIFEYNADATTPAPIPTDSPWDWTNYSTQGPGSYQQGTATTPGFSGNYIKFNDNNSSFGVVQHTHNLTATTEWTFTAVGHVPTSSHGNMLATHFRIFAPYQTAGGATVYKGFIVSFINDIDEANPNRSGFVLGRTGTAFNSWSTYKDYLKPFDLSSDYVTTQLHYDPETTTLSLYANGQFIDSILAADALSGWGDVNGTVHWGRGTAAVTAASESHWNLVRLETGNTVIPEPSTYVLLGAGLFGAALLRWKRGLRRAA